MKIPLRTQSPRIFSLALLISALGLASPSTPSAGDWSKLLILTPGDEIRIVVDSGELQYGNFGGATDAGITLHVATGVQTVSRESVRQVLMKREGHRGRNALIGTTVGAIVGLVIGVASDRSNSRSFINPLPNGGKIAGTGAGALIGVGIGSLLPTGGWKTIYDAR